MELLYYAVVMLVILIALGDWRTGLYLCVLLDVLRDPARKLTEGQPVAITVAGALVWVVVALSAFHAERHASSAMVHMYPKLKNMPLIVVLALLPGAMLSVLLYSGGWKLALIGAASYLLPIGGVVLGFLIVNSAQSVERLLKIYVISNSLMLIGTFLEYMGLDVAGLGGIDMHWVRYHGGYTVELIAGFYRSPDIMGLHAANVAVFALILAQRAREEKRLGWLALMFSALFCLVLCGRRKMIGVPLVFLASMLLIGHLRGARKATKWMVAVGFCLLVGFCVFLVAAEEEFSNEYLAYATTTVTEGPRRANTLVLGWTIGTIIQSGALGGGLGTGTQGSRYANVHRSFAGRGWQEDGVSRVFLEFGIPGVVLLLIAGKMLVRVVLRALRSVPANTPLQMFQIALLAAFLANTASYVISHQHFSGDPAGAFVALLLFGACLGIPRLLHTVPAVPNLRYRESAPLPGPPGSITESQRRLT